MHFWLKITDCFVTVCGFYIKNYIWSVLPLWIIWPCLFVPISCALYLWLWIAVYRLLFCGYVMLSSPKYPILIKQIMLTPYTMHLKPVKLPNFTMCLAVACALCGLPRLCILPCVFDLTFAWPKDHHLDQAPWAYISYLTPVFIT